MYASHQTPDLSSLSSSIYSFALKLCLISISCLSSNALSKTRTPWLSLGSGLRHIVWTTQTNHSRANIQTAWENSPACSTATSPTPIHLHPSGVLRSTSNYTFHMTGLSLQSLSIHFTMKHERRQIIQLLVHSKSFAVLEDDHAVDTVGISPGLSRR